MQSTMRSRGPQFAPRASGRMPPTDVDLPEGGFLRFAAPKTQSPLARAYAWVTISLFSALFMVVPLATIGIVIATLLVPWLMWPVALVWAGLAAWPCTEWPAFRLAFCRWVITHWMPLFSLRIVMDGDLPPQVSRGYLLGVHPHGIVPLGGMLYMGYLAQEQPGVFGRTAAASIVLRLPVFRQMFYWLGMVPASLSTVQHHIRDRNLAVLPGGIAELMLCSRDTETLYLRKRTGIVRVAAEAGATMVPSYVFGQTQLFDQLATSKGWAADVSRWLRMSLTIFWGQFGLPIPHRTQISLVFGQPIAMTGDVAVDLQTYIDAVQGLYDKYKGWAGFADKKLVIR